MAEETAKQEEVKEETAAPAEESKEESKEVPAKFKGLVDQISELSVLDLSELVKVLEDHFGVSAAAPVAVAAAGAAGGVVGGDVQVGRVLIHHVARDGAVRFVGHRVGLLHGQGGVALAE